MKVFQLCAGLLVSLTLAGPLAAQEDSQLFAVEGAGALTCASFIQARQDKGSAEYQRFIGFVEGFITAANRYEPNTFDLTPWHNAAAYDLILEKHCSTHQEETMVSVVQKMVTGFKPIRVAQPTSLLEVGDGNYRVYVYDAVLRRAQAALKLRGLYSGEENGRYTPELRTALREFQKSQDLTETGVPDPATLWTLLNP